MRADFSARLFDASLAPYSSVPTNMDNHRKDRPRLGELLGDRVKTALGKLNAFLDNSEDWEKVTTLHPREF